MTKSAVEKHFDEVAGNYDFYTKKRELHYLTLKKLLRGLIPRRKRVLEVGCGTGDILASLDSKYGYGMDLSSKMINNAKIKYQKSRNLIFSTRWPKRRFDYIFMSDVVEHLENPKETFAKISRLMTKDTTFVCSMMNRVWIPIEAVYNMFGWKMPEGPYYRIRYAELEKIVKNSGLKIIKHDYKLLMPIKIPLVTYFANKYLEKYLRRFAFIEYFVAVSNRT